MATLIHSTCAGLLSVFWLTFGLAAGAEPPPSLDELLKEYQALGLPMPPKEAKLVRFEHGGGGTINGKVQPRTFSVGFEVKPATKTEGPILFTRTYAWQPDWKPPTQDLEPKPAAVKDLRLDTDGMLMLAIQCHARGWGELAQHLLDRSQKNLELPARRRLIQLAWYYWEGHLIEPKIDRAPLAKRLKELIRQDKELQTERNRAILKSLDLALVPSKAKHGSVEALIDDLVDYSGHTGTIGIFVPGDRYWRIANLGFDAAPALIEHLDDDRLTRGMMQGFNNFTFWNLRVRHVVSDLLQELAREELGRDWLVRQQGYAVEKADAKKWWEKARKIGEEKYVLEHVLPSKTEEYGRGQVSVHLLNLILVKYPKHIPSLYRKVLDKHPELESWSLAEAVLRCNLPEKERLDLFHEAAKHKEYRHRVPAFDALKDLDRKQFDSVLLAAIESIPKDIPGAYWACPESQVARLAITSDEPRIWPTLEKVARRSALGLRMELLNQFGDPRDRRHRSERLRLLAGFLDDAELRIGYSSPQFTGPGAGFPYDKIEVRDFVATELARMLEIKIEVNQERTPQEWAKIRGQVQEAVKRELSKMQ